MNNGVIEFNEEAVREKINGIGDEKRLMIPARVAAKRINNIDSFLNRLYTAKRTNIDKLLLMFKETNHHHLNPVLM